MDRDWRDFKSSIGNLAGAREAFEDACETLFRKKYEDQPVSQVKVKQGDGGVDVFIGELGVKPIIVIQCKFFLDAFGESQYNQIRSSFKKAITSDKYEMKEWILCVPILLDIDQNKWWFMWRDKMIKEYGLGQNAIKLINGNELIGLFKEHQLYNRVFNIEDSIKIDKILEAVVPKKVETKEAKIADILFNNYTKRSEPFYISRKSDIQFNDSLKISNIWIFGKSGFGKTALINRNLIQNEQEYCFCDLSPISIEKVDDVLDEILCTIEEKFSKERDIKESNLLKQISKILCSIGPREIVIVIDELAVFNDEVLRDIADSLASLVTHYENQSYDSNELKFVISTISNPKGIIKNKSKASGYFEYICCDSWKEYSSELFDVLSQGLNLDIDNSKCLILSKSNNSPRMIKNIFRKILVSNDTSNKAIEEVIKITLDEAV